MFTKASESNYKLDQNDHLVFLILASDFSSFQYYKFLINHTAAEEQVDLISQATFGNCEFRDKCCSEKSSLRGNRKKSLVE